jgi:DHA1 family bicyclomycin/chloramphenicol resistance-like MFS transporter
MKNNSLLRNALILGLITAVGPFAIDMYLPALPAIGRDLGDPKGAMLTLTAFFASFGVFQLIFGTVSDMYGRRGPLLAGLVLFVATGIGCALSHSLTALIVLRFLQGIGGAAGIIIARAVVRDLYHGVQEVKMMSMLMLVFSISPLLAPLTGSYIVEYLNWQSVFWVLSGLGVLAILLILTSLSETWPKEKRIGAGFGSMLAAFSVLIRDRPYIGMTLIGACGITTFFIFLGNSSFVMMGFYHLSPRGFSVVFSLNAIAFFAAAQANGWLAKRFSIHAIILPAALGFAGCMSVMAAFILLGQTSLYLMLSLMFAGFAFLGLIIPTISVLALADHGEIAGTAASVMNTVQMVIGSIAIGVSGMLADGTPVPMAVGIAGSAILTMACSLWTFAGHKIGEPA